MAIIEAFVASDVPGVARLHAKRFWGSPDAATPGLESYYRTAFLNHPWLDEELPSLVYRDGEGQLTGFIGRIARPMRYGDARVRCAVGHRLIVSGESPFAAIELVQRFLEGPQDFSFADGGNDTSIQLLCFAGFSQCQLYSLGWFRPICPIRFATSVAAKRSRPASVIHGLFQPFTRAADLFLSSSSSTPLRIPESSLEEADIDASSLYECTRLFARNYTLRPEYRADDLDWLLRFLEKNQHRGVLDGFICKKQGRAVGACLYYMRTDHVIEVLVLSAEPRRRDDVLAHLIQHAHRRRALAVVGRLEPNFLASYWKHGCLVKQADWAVVHSPQPQILQAITTGNAYITALDAELWLRSPMDRI